MSDLVRVRDTSTRHQFTTSRDYATERGWEIIDRPAVDRDGTPLPPKYYKPLTLPSRKRE